MSGLPLLFRVLMVAGLSLSGSAALEAFGPHWSKPLAAVGSLLAAVGGLFAPSPVKSEGK